MTIEENQSGNIILTWHTTAESKQIQGLKIEIKSMIGNVDSVGNITHKNGTRQ